MKKYFLYLLYAYQEQMAFRGTMFFRVLRDTANVLFFIILWASLYRDKAEIAGFTFPAMVTYYILVKIIDQLYSYGPSRRLNEHISSGDLSNFLSKPIKYYLFLLAHSFGMRSARTTFSLLIIVGIFLLAPYWVTFPPSAESLIFFLVSAALSWFLLFEIAFFLGTLAFWASETGSLRTAFEQMILVLGGSWVPLNFFPSQFAPILEALPFKYLFYSLVLIYQGKIPPSQMLPHLTGQIVWIIIIGLMGYILWRKGVKRYGAFGK